MSSQTTLGRRNEDRFPARECPFDVWSNEGRLTLDNFSGQGLGVVLPASARPGERQLTLELRQDLRPFARLVLDITHRRSVQGGTLVGGPVRAALPIRSTQPTLPGRGDSVEIRDESIRRRLLFRLGGARAPGTLYVASGRRLPVVTGFGARDAVEGEFLVRLVAPEEAPINEGEAGTLETVLSDGAFRVEGLLSSRPEATLRVEHARVFSVGRRQYGRVSPSPHRVSIEWTHPLDPSRVVSAEVIDFSAKGIKLVVGSESVTLLPPPGALLVVQIDEERIPVLAEVRHVETRAGGESHAGLRLTPVHEHHAATLAHAYERLRWPMLVHRGSAPKAALDDLMRKSGYLSLRDETTAAPGWHSPPADLRLTADLVHLGAEGVLAGHVSCLRTYPHTWILHQLATLGPRKDKVAYPLYVQVVEWMLALTEREAFALAYFNHSSRWHQTMFSSFPAFVGSDSLSAVVSLDRLERDGEERVAQVEGALVRPAVAEELAFVAELARAFLPPLVADALHIYAERVTADVLCAEHAKAGLERGRVALVVEVEGELVGAALCETGARSLSLFNILNMAHVFFVRTSDQVRARAAETALLHATRRFYEERGVSDPIVVTPQGCIAVPEAAGFTVTETMGCFVASREGLKQWKNYTHYVLGALGERGLQAAREDRAALARVLTARPPDPRRDDADPRSLVEKDSLQ